MCTSLHSSLCLVPQTKRRRLVSPSEIRYSMESPASSSEAPAVSSCRRKKNFGSGSFVSDLRSHFHEFIFASMDEHRICLVETFKKMKSKFYKEKSATGPNEGEASLPLQNKD